MDNKVVCYYCGTIYNEERGKCPLCGSSTRSEETGDRPVQRQRLTDKERRERQRANAKGKYSAKAKKPGKPSKAAKGLLTAALIAGIVVMLLRHPEYTKAFRAGLWLIAGGGLGNLYDRLVYGYVIDFIEFSFIRFPVFNPADIFICVGAALMLLDTIVSEARKKHGCALYLPH